MISRSIATGAEGAGYPLIALLILFDEWDLPEVCGISRRRTELLTDRWLPTS